MQHPPHVERIVSQLKPVQGVQAIVLGGSPHTRNDIPTKCVCYS